MAWIVFLLPWFAWLCGRDVLRYHGQNLLFILVARLVDLIEVKKSQSEVPYHQHPPPCESIS